MAQNIQFFLFVILLIACAQAGEHSTSDKISAVSTGIRHKRGDLWEPGYRFIPPKQEHPAFQGLQLLDVVLLASVDGKLHGLNRTTGQPLWSMYNDPDSTAPSTFSSLVRTQHSAHDPEREFFIIEPQSGDIYVLPPMASPSDSLQRLPLTIQQLVELSPFTFPGDDTRVFVGTKETSMVILELETGRVKGTINADKECFWDDQPEAEEEDFDSSAAPKRGLRSPLVHIGRTDYHIRIHSRHHGVIQNLYYSSYGPNNVDRERQSKWDRTPDNLYIQSLPNGQVLAFQTEGPDMAEPIHYDGMPIWGRDFKQPVVAVFDVVLYPTHIDPVPLLQPRPHLEQLFPKHSDAATPRLAHTMPQLTYVGLVEDSLYAMGYQNYPLVVFDQTPPLYIPEGDTVNNPPCNGVECLVGARKTEPELQWYPPPLIDPPAPSEKTPRERPPMKRPVIEVGPPELETQINQSILPINELPTRWEMDIRTWGIVGFTLLLGLIVARLCMNYSGGFIRTHESTITPVKPILSEDRDPIPEQSHVIPTQDISRPITPTENVTPSRSGCPYTGGI
ncbi:hypothetical protein Clacol_010600 [Clathrus columnatus]|uniref:Uncharacterized protein n=1 Tax=Clathrus columnatus TaxID=1419009 RepID=A0AAV5AUI1_9AGAM|nr:hypothetical protein Clacol_010600 [Clathrus columnatus]